MFSGLKKRIATWLVPRSGIPEQVRVSEEVWYSLEDGEECNRLYPDTFLIPPRKAREGLQPGQIVKLMFDITAGEDRLVERMWIIVERRDGDEFVGVLDNQPTSTDQMRPGIAVRFQPRHVIAIYS